MFVLGSLLLSLPQTNARHCLKKPFCKEGKPQFILPFEHSKSDIASSWEVYAHYTFSNLMAYNLTWLYM